MYILTGEYVNTVLKLYFVRLEESTEKKEATSPYIMII